MGQAIHRIATLGIVGGGQLARMTALAARKLGFATHVLASRADCPAATVVERVIVGSPNSLEDVLTLARECEVMTLDSEHVSVDALAQASQLTLVHPSAEALRVVQDRRVQKEWLRAHGFPVGPFRCVRSEHDLSEALQAFETAVFIKSARGGYDGTGQGRYERGSSAEEIGRALSSFDLTVEAEVPYASELSVLVARSAAGEIAIYEPSLNQHKSGVLDVCVFPAPVSADVARRAQRLARRITEQLAVVGLLCVELFLLPDGTLLVNELAPRPHNSYHGTERACATSQFEQLVRAVAGLPLGSVRPERHAATCNLLGELWCSGAQLDFRAALAMRGLSAHVYGKTQAHPGRKMGHLIATASDADDALARVLAARRALTQNEGGASRSEGGG